MSNSLHLQSRRVTRSLIAPTLFGELDEAVRTALLAAAPVRHFDDQQIIAQRGDTPSGFWVIKSGSVKIGQFRSGGEFRGIAILSARDSLGELAVFSQSKRAVDAVSDGQTQLHWIDAAAFETAMMADPAAMRRLISVLSVQMQELLGLMSALNSTSSAARLASLLLNLAGPDQENPVIALGQQELAEMLGLTRATVNKALSQLESEGAIKRQYGSVDILDRARLVDRIED